LRFRDRSAPAGSDEQPGLHPVIELRHNTQRLFSRRAIDDVAARQQGEASETRTAQKHAARRVGQQRCGILDKEAGINDRNTRFRPAHDLSNERTQGKIRIIARANDVPKIRGTLRLAPAPPQGTAPGRPDPVVSRDRAAGGAAARLRQWYRPPAVRLEQRPKFSRRSAKDRNRRSSAQKRLGLPVRQPCAPVGLDFSLHYPRLAPRSLLFGEHCVEGLSRTASLRCPGALRFPTISGTRPAERDASPPLQP
jgi:hypothetical protein